MNSDPDSIQILHVDDDPDFVELASRFLERQDERFDVTPAADAGAALESLDQQAFDCIVSDFDMPGTDGLGFLEAVRAGYPDLPFILYTGKGSEEVASEAISVGVTDYLQKGTGPEQYEILANRIGNAIEAYRAQQAIEASERELRQVYERITDGFFAVNPEWEYIYANEEAARLTDRSVDELIGSTVWELFPELAGTVFEDALRTAMETQETTTVEEYYPPHDSWYDVRVYGAEEGISVYFQDVTERHERQYDLELIDQVVGAMNDGLVITRDGMIEHVNPPVTDVLGYDEADLLGSPMREFIAPAYRDTVEERHQGRSAGQAEEPPQMDEIAVLTSGGAEIPVEITVSRIEYEGQPATLSLVRETSSAQEQARELRQLKDEYETVFDTAKDAIFLFDVESHGDDFEFRLHRLNPAHEALSGLSTAEDRGKTPRELLGEELGAEVAEKYRRCVETGDPIEYEEVLSMPTGTIHWHTKLVPVFGAGEVTRVIGIARDISERKEREQTLKRLVERGADLIGASSIQETAQVAIEIARDVIEAPLAGVHLLTDDQRLEAVATMDEVSEAFDVPPTYDRASDGPVDRLVWETFERGESRYIEEVEALGDVADETPARSAMLHPLDGRGILIISTTEPNGFDETDRLYVELLAQTLSAALDTIERETVARRHKQRLERLHGAAEAIHQAGSREEIARRVVEAVEDILGFPIVTVRFYRDEENALVPVALSESTTEIVGTRAGFTPDDGSLNWAAYEAGTTKLYEDISDIDGAHDADSPIASLMLFPLGAHGTVSVADTTPQSFDESDRFHGELLAKTAELALSQVDREQALIRQRDQLDRQNRRLEQFAGVVSHDLRNPLNVAQGRLELAREDCDSEHLDAVDRSHDRMAALIDDLLALAREGDHISETERVDLATVVEECWRNVDTVRAELVTDYEGTIQADLTRLSQLLENLIRNAVEHGGDDVTITVGEIEGGFYVEDDGPGIPEADRQAVLEPGYSTGEAGTGFGLAIVLEIARAHGWELTLTEGADGGARFEITGVT